MTNPNVVNTKVVVRGLELAFDMLHSGVASLLSSSTSLVMGGKSVSQPDLLKAIEAACAPVKDERVAKAAYKKAVLARKERSREARKLVREVRAAIRVVLGEENPDLARFGIAPKSDPRPLTPEEKTLRAEKARRTRELRHTLGSRQKASIKAADVRSLAIGPDAGTTPGPSKIPA